MRFFLAAKRTFCVITLYALEIRALFFTAAFVANFDDYRCVACCKRAYSCGETIKKHAGSIFLSNTVHPCLHTLYVRTSTAVSKCPPSLLHHIRYLPAPIFSNHIRMSISMADTTKLRINNKRTDIFHMLVSVDNQYATRTT